MKNRSNPIQALMLVILLLSSATAGAAAAAPKVNINTATAEELGYLPRVGPVVAQRILEFREQNGRFKEAKQLLLVQGIGEKTFELIEPYVAIEGETTLTEKVRVPEDSRR